MQTVKCSKIFVEIKAKYDFDPNLREAVFDLFPENNYSDRMYENFRSSAKIYIGLKPMALTYLGNAAARLYDRVRCFPDAEEMTVRAVTQYGDTINTRYVFDRRKNK